MVVSVDMELQQLVLPKHSWQLCSVRMLALVPPFDRVACPVALTLSHAWKRWLLHCPRSLPELVICDLSVHVEGLQRVLTACCLSVFESLLVQVAREFA